MEQDTKRFSLLDLMMVRDLEFRKAAAANAAMTVEEYIGYLSKFIDDAPAALNALSQIISSEQDGETANSLSTVKNDLEKAGCRSFSLTLSEIINGSASAEDVGKFAERFSAFYKRIVKAQNAPLSADSEEKIGGAQYASALKSTLPVLLERVDKEEQTRKLRILAVDDAAFMLRSLSSILSEKYKVYTVAKSTMVNAFLDQVVPELFLLDYKMPDISGFDLVPIIRAREEHQDTPIIFMTAMGTIENLSAAMKLGACDFIVKPFKTATLLQRVEKHIERKKLF
jgi:CheY-like chemotaxis protein